MQKLPPYYDDDFWHGYLKLKIVEVMEGGMRGELPICPPYGHGDGHSFQFMAVVNQSTLLAQYFNYLEKRVKKTRSEICDFVAEMIEFILQEARIIHEDGSVTTSDMKLVAVTCYPAEEATCSQEVTGKLTARTHYVVHYDGF